MQKTITMYSSRDQCANTKSNESVTFRLDKQVLAKLKEEAKQKQVSVNTLINQITKQHTDWHSAAAEAGFIPVRRHLLVKLLQKFDDTKEEEQIRSLAADMARDANKDFISLLRREYGIQSTLDIIETWIRVSGYSYRREIVNNSGHRFFIQHDMGRKWSLYLSELYRGMIQEFGVSNIGFDISENTLTFDVEINDGSSRSTNRWSSNNIRRSALACISILPIAIVSLNIQAMTITSLGY